MKKTISIIVPIYNEKDNIPILYDAVVKELKHLFSYDYEIIFINDGSTDCSWQLLYDIALCDERVKAFSFSRNFGHQIALIAGYDQAQGDCIISMDADMQDPPTLIEKMIKKWEDGADIVYARRIDRKDGFLKKVTAHLYYRFLSLVSDAAIPRNVGDFRLIDKKVLHVLLSCREKSPYLRGIVAWTGFTHAFVDFRRANRTAGKSGYTWKKMLKLALDGLTGFSTFPLKIAGYIGGFIMMMATFIGVYMLFSLLIRGIDYSLVAWLAEGLLFVVGIQFQLIWLLGEYVGRMFEQEKGRPLYIVAHKVDGAMSARSAQMNVGKYKNKIV